MKLFKTLMLISLFQVASTIHAQEYLPKAKTYDGTSIGVGFGQDFGGVGIGILHYGIYKYVGIFGGLGYTPAGVGMSAGLKVRLVSPKYNVNPFVSGMYGYTTALSVSNDTQFS